MIIQKFGATRNIYICYFVKNTQRNEGLMKVEHQIYPKHNLPLEFLNPDKSILINRMHAINVSFEYHKPISIQQIKQSNQKVIKQFEQQLEQNRNSWNISIDSLISIREIFIKQIKIIESIIDVIRNQIQQSINQFNNIKVDNIEVIKQGHECYLKKQQTHQRDITSQIEVLNQDKLIDELVIGLNELNLQKLNYIMKIQQRKLASQKFKINRIQNKLLLKIKWNKRRLRDVIMN